MKEWLHRIGHSVCLAQNLGATLTKNKDGGHRPNLGVAAGGMQTIITGSQHLVGAALVCLNGGALV
jgi:hypothetical protein